VTPRTSPVHLLWGEDEFLLRDAALQVVGPDVQPREVEAGEWQGGETADLATPSLFGERRALVVTECRALTEEALREIGTYLSAPDPEATLVLVATVPERGKAPAALVKLVEPVGTVREVKVARKDLPAWLVQRARAREVDLAPEGAAALVETLGEEPAALEQALTQLASAFPEQRLTRDLVAQQFRGLGEQHMWDLCDKAFGRDLEGSMRSLSTMLEAREDPLLILGGIASRLRDLLRVRSLPDRMPPADLARAAGLRFEWQARRYRDQARRFSLEELVALHGEVVEADRALKSGGAGDVVLPVLVSRIAGSPVRVG
jgi:DNA polymerase III subunit delta